MVPSAASFSARRAAWASAWRSASARWRSLTSMPNATTPTTRSSART